MPEVAKDRSDANSRPHITILGGGVAGLAAGFYARRRGIPFTLFEASDHIGGNCRTLRQGPFCFDTGAHRFHDRDPAVTDDLLELMRRDLHEVHAPNQICCQGRFIDFPLSPLNVAQSLGLRTSLRAGIEVVQRKLRGTPEAACFESFARGQYGDTIAETLLLNYSEKLWGVPGNQLSPEVAGRRLQGLTFGTLLREALVGRRGKTRHLDGSFLYPREGIGMIADRLAEACGADSIRKGARITRLFVEQGRVQAIEVNGRERIATDRVVCSLPLTELVRDLTPAPPPAALTAAASLQYRAMVLVTLFLARDRVTPNASIYFPDPDLPFTRLYEPKNRSQVLAPPGCTSLMAEIPCQPEDDVYRAADDALAARVSQALVRLGLIEARDCTGRHVMRLACAYPVLRKGADATVGRILGHLRGIANLALTGRNGLFQYIHIHDVMRWARDYIEALP